VTIGYGGGGAFIDKLHMNCTELHCITVYCAVLFCAVRASRDVLDECLSSIRSVARAVLLPGAIVGRYWVPRGKASSECQGEKRGDAR
jgi:hypothetical protein